MSVKDFFNSLSNYELSTLIIISVIIALSLFKKSTRKSYYSILKIIFSKWILLMLSTRVVYSFLIIFTLYKVNFWDFTLLKDSIFWFIGSAVFVLFNLNKANSKAFFKNLFKDNLKLIIVLEFIAGVHEYELLNTTIIYVIIIFLALIQAYINTQKTESKLNDFINICLAIFGLSTIILSIIDIANDWQAFFNIDNLKVFLLPIILSICFIPCVYTIAFLMKLQDVFIRLKLRIRDIKMLRYAKKRVIKKSKFSLDKVNNILLSLPKFNEYYPIKKKHIKAIIK